MLSFNFTERVRTALAKAREEAASLQHEYIGAEHLLLGLVADTGSLAATALHNLGADPGAVADRVRQIVRPGAGAGRSMRPDLPYTSRAKKVLELSAMEAADLHHSYVGTEHMLIGLCREGQTIAAQVLQDFGVTSEAARAEVLRMLGEAEESRTPRQGERVVSIAISFRYESGVQITKTFASAHDAIGFLESM